MTIPIVFGVKTEIVANVKSEAFDVSRAVPALAERDPGGDQMRASQRFGEAAVDPESIDEHLS
ncbi:MAG: hypothetical protein ACREX4_20525, partial [Gammaproteobacteria bacterium]